MNIAIIGGGPAGLMAAEKLATEGASVIVYDRKPSLGRKFLMAGRGGLNLTHSEPLEIFMEKYGAAKNFLTPAIDDLTPDQLRAWCEGLGQETFIGTSGRVFPKAMKASPLLRAWLKRLGDLGVQFKLQREWKGWSDDGGLIFDTPDGLVVTHKPDAVLFTLGGASWPSLGSDGAWAKILKSKQIAIVPFKPSNCGFVCNWSDYMKEKHAGTPLKNIALTHGDKTVHGEIIITQNGIEGGAVYALSPVIRDHLPCTISIDLRPALSIEPLLTKLNIPRGRQSLSTYLKKTVGLTPAAIALLRESKADIQTLSPDALAAYIKSVPLTLTEPFSMERAISTAGGIRLDALDSNLMIREMPSYFAAGEMLDWEAPTGGYLLQASFATGYAAAKGMIKYLKTA